MDSASYFISPSELWMLIGTERVPQIVDTRRRDVYESARGVLPGVVWRDVADIAQWSATLDRNRPVVFACRFGHQMSQIPAAMLRADGFEAHVLAGGHEAWDRAKLPLVNKLALDRLAPKRPSLWVTRRRPKIDRVACPWLIRRFIDPQARILYVESDQVVECRERKPARSRSTSKGSRFRTKARAARSTPCSSCSGWRANRHSIALALIVRGADTARADLAAEAAGLHAISLGLSALAGDDDHGLLRQGFMVYDALFAYLRHAAQERHNWPAKPACTKAA